MPCLSYQLYFLSYLPLQLKLLLIVNVDIRAQLYFNQLQFCISYHSMTAACGHSYNVTWLYHLLHIIHDGFSLTRYDYSHLIPVLVTVIVHTVATVEKGKVTMEKISPEDMNFVCDGNCEGCPMLLLDCTGERAACPCNQNCDESEAL